MRGSYKRIAVTAVIAICSFVANLLSVPTPVMATFAFALLASLGYVWVEVILRGRAPTLELVSVAVGLVLSVPVIGGVSLQEADIPLHRLAWSVLFVGLTLVGDVVLTFRYRSEVRDDKLRLRISASYPTLRSATEHAAGTATALGADPGPSPTIRAVHECAAGKGKVAATHLTLACRRLWTSIVDHRRCDMASPSRCR